MAEAWAPTVGEVAQHIPGRTIPTTGVGEQAPLGTFNANTTPTDVQAQGIIDRTVSHVAARTGTVAEALHGAAKDVAALRAAGLIELAYPERDADINTAEQLLEQADTALDDLVTANTGAAVGANPVPLYNFPPPHPYGDAHWI